MVVKPGGKQLLAEGHAIFLAHGIDAVGLPHFLGRFHDEGRSFAVELVGVRLKPPVLGLHEGEGEGIEGLLCAEPDEAALARVDVGLEGLGVAGANAAVEPVAGDHEVGLVLRGQGLVVAHVGLKHQVHAQCQAAFLQDVQQPLAADAAEAVAAGAHAAALEEDVDVVPVVERLADQRGGFGVGHAQVAQRLVGEHHAPAEGVKRAIALHHGDGQCRVAPLHEKGEIQPGRPAADAQDALESRMGGVHV